MTDIVDHAKERETLIRDKALEAQRNNREPEPEQWIEDGHVLCIDCGGFVDKDRLEVKPNAARCIGCQTRHEVRRKNGR